MRPSLGGPVGVAPQVQLPLQLGQLEVPGLRLLRQLVPLRGGEKQKNK
jgi:hypothetical protein